MTFTSKGRAPASVLLAAAAGLCVLSFTQAVAIRAPLPDVSSNIAQHLSVAAAAPSSPADCPCSDSCSDSSGYITHKHITAPIADAIIAISYWAIPIELAFFVVRLPNITTYQKAVGALFICFIMLCGVGHLLDALRAPVTLVILDRYLTAFISAVTAILSPQVLSYSVDAIIQFNREGALVAKQRDMLADAQAMAHMGNWEIEERENGMKWLTASEEWFRIFGIAVDDDDEHTIPFCRYLACVAEEDRQNVLSAVHEAIERLQPYHLIQRVHRESDGKEIFIRGFGKPVLDGQKRVVGMRGTSQDITAEVMRNRELTKAKELALIESKHKDTFLATMSHELRTPLTSIIGHVELMEETTLDEIQREYNGNAKRAATTLLSLINDILDYSKLQAGMVDLELRTVELSELLRDVHCIVKDLGKDVKLKIDSYEGPPVVADAMRIRQVLLNLISNGLKFTMPGGYVHVSNKHYREMPAIPAMPFPGMNGVNGQTEASPPVARENITFTVRDSGIGMSPTALAKLFHPFCQADASTSRRFGGTGLGLSIVKKLVSAMGGDVKVTSKEGEGSTFLINFSFPHADVVQTVQHLPPITSTHPPRLTTSRTNPNLTLLSQKSQTALTTPLPLLPTPPPHERQQRPIRILLAEDNLVTQKMVLRMLQKYHVDTVDNGQLAVDRVREHPPYDILLCDVNMPVMDGLEAVKQIRRLAKGMDLYIVGLTANAFKTDRDGCFDAGMDDFLSKPFTKAALLGVVEKAVGERRRKLDEKGHFLSEESLWVQQPGDVTTTAAVEPMVNGVLAKSATLTGVGNHNRRPNSRQATPPPLSPSPSIRQTTRIPITNASPNALPLTLPLALTPQTAVPTPQQQQHGSPTAEGYGRERPTHRKEPLATEKQPFLTNGEGWSNDSTDSVDHP
ncbi:uncharacterized protein EV422DRAFT_548620 [Fimicolochytrium jonesii]|uniref:uncharacterized protein n=1 Tax=Fimicolochytrium jonesii TaxID=1396493 RepID=UPI0022FEE5A4|nr:uncharacterized protein EV422DRAFT_548620 [Fimicolochytrium jonesii]KAI8815663.1 hypothetical protein EV422DRAFT_548620 [Fimicolochytrium jonesii]